MDWILKSGGRRAALWKMGGWLLLVGLLLGCNEPLHHDLDEREANAMVVTLHQKGLEAEKIRDPDDDERWAVEVPRPQRIDAWTVLQQEGFPWPDRGGFDDFYPGGGLIPTAQEERVVLQYATARELQSSLLRVEGIVDAHVHLVLPEQPRVQLTGSETSDPRASVLVQWRAGMEQPPLDAEGIRQLVSGAVEDLDPEAVHVVMSAVSGTEQPRAEFEFAQVGPISVAPHSQGLLRFVMLLMGAVIIALSAGLVYMVLTRKRGNREGGMA